MLSFFFVNIAVVLQKLSQPAKPRESRKILCANGTIRPAPTFDMLVPSDVSHQHSLTALL